LKLNHKILVIETVPATIGIELEKDQMYDIFKKDSVLPATTKSEFELVTDDRTEWKSNIYEGENSIPQGNSLLSTLTLPLPFERGRALRIELQFEYAADGDIVASFQNKGNSSRKMKSKNSSPTRTKRLSRLLGLPQPVLDQMKRTDQNFSTDEEAERNRMNCKLIMEEYICDALDLVAECPSTEITREIACMMKESLQWLDEHSMASARELGLRCEVLENSCMPRLSKLGTEFTEHKVVASAKQKAHYRPDPVSQTSTTTEYIEPVANHSMLDKSLEPSSELKWPGRSSRFETITQQYSQASARTTVQAIEQSQPHSSDPPNIKIETPISLDSERNHRLLANSEEGESALKFPREQSCRLTIIENVAPQPEEHRQLLDRTKEDMYRRTTPLTQEPNEQEHETADFSILIKDAFPVPASDVDNGAFLQEDSDAIAASQAHVRYMQDLFSSSRSIKARYTDAEFLQIASFLNNTGRSSWSTVPRLYTILRLVNQLDCLDAFIGQGMLHIPN
jgi:hypothetical protein